MEAMIPSQHCLEFIKKEEGCRLKAYQDDAGIWTIGYGIIEHPDGTKVKEGDQISQERADELLAWQTNLKGKKVAGMTEKVQLRQCQYDSLVSFAFNNGTAGLQSSTLLHHILTEGPNAYKTIAVTDIEDEQIRHWMQKQNIRGINNVTYYFCMWCKISVVDEVTRKPKKILSDSLVRRRIREAVMYQSS